MIKLYAKCVCLAVLGLAAAAALSLAAPAFAGEGPAASKAHDIGNGAAAESKALAAGIEALLQRSPSSMQVKQTADGTMSVYLGTSFLNFTVVLVGPDGAIRQVCVGNAAASNTSVIPPLAEDK